MDKALLLFAFGLAQTAVTTFKGLVETCKLVWEILKGFSRPSDKTSPVPTISNTLSNSTQHQSNVSISTHSPTTLVINHHAPSRSNVTLVRKRKQFPPNQLDLPLG